MSNRLKNRYEKVSASIAGVFLAATALNACSAEEIPAEHNPDATMITIEKDANIRQNPAVDNGGDDGIPNTIFKNIGKEFSFRTPEGVEEKEDEDNGVWYGVPVESFPVDYRGTLMGDKDGIVWVNSQKANIVETVETPVSTTK